MALGESAGMALPGIRSTMTPEQEERLVAAFESLAAGVNGIAAAADLLAMNAEARLAVEHPPKPDTPREMVITRLKTEEDLIREEHGGEDAEAPIDRWTSLGPREAEFEEVGRKGSGADSTAAKGSGS